MEFKELLTNKQTLLVMGSAELRQALHSYTPQLVETYAPQLQRLISLPIAKEGQAKEKLYTHREACKILNISQPTIDKWSDLGILHRVRIGWRVYYKCSEVDKIASKGMEPTKDDDVKA